MDFTCVRLLWWMPGSGASRYLRKYRWPPSLTRSAWQLVSSARILAQMNTRVVRRSDDVVCWGAQGGPGHA